MSLVVAQILNDGTITMVGDTKLLFDFEEETQRFDEARSRRIYERAFPKVVILGHDLAVGVAGAGLPEAVAALVGFRGLPVDELLHRLQNFAGVTFVVAALDPARLWTVEDGEIDDRTRPRRAWGGDTEPYNKFRRLLTRDYLPHWDEEQRLLASMQTLVHLVEPVTVGGYVIHLTVQDGAFRFVPNQANIAPSHLNGEFHQSPDGTIHGRITVPSGVDPTVTGLIQLVGKAPTPAALALYVPPARTAWLFTHERPWESITLRGNSTAKIIRAAAEHGQRVSKCGCHRDDH